MYASEGPLSPSSSKARADYGRGFYFCSSCGKGYYNADKCPVCGTKTRKEGRKDNGEDKPRVNIDFNESG